MLIKSLCCAAVSCRVTYKDMIEKNKCVDDLVGWYFSLSWYTSQAVEDPFLGENKPTSLIHDNGETEKIENISPNS